MYIIYDEAWTVYCVTNTVSFYCALYTVKGTVYNVSVKYIVQCTR